jgi:hypothetical protein
MQPPSPSKQQVIALMRRLGLHDRIDEAERDLPEVIDLTRDAATLARLGLGLDIAVNALGADPW